MKASHADWIDLFEDRAGILEFDAALSRVVAERQAFAEISGSLIKACALDPNWLETVGQWRSDNLPVTWIIGALLLQGSPPRGDWPDWHWAGLQDAVTEFCSTWAVRALDLGWIERGLFGCHKEAPWWRLDGMGLALRCYRGAELISLDETGAVFRVNSTTQTYRRGQNAPLYPVDQGLIWTL